MKTFQEYQTLANKVPLSLRNNLDRIRLPVSGLPEEAGKLGSLLMAASTTGKFHLAKTQRTEMEDRLADVLWYIALICGETGIALQDVATHSIKQLQTRAKDLDLDRR